MPTIFEVIARDWSIFWIPLAVFAVSVIALFWLRRLMLVYLTRWTQRMKWPRENFLILSLRSPSALLALVFSAYLGVAISVLAAEWKALAGNFLWTLFIIALTISLLHLAHSMAVYYTVKLKLPKRIAMITRNVLRVIVIVVAVLMIMALWGIPTSPILLIIAVLVIAAIVAFRTSFPGLISSIQIAATQEYKVGDYIKLDSGEEGNIMDISWNRTSLRGLDGATILVPNQKLTGQKVTNYGKPLKKARHPFHFNTRTYLAELTGLRAGSLADFTEILKTAPDSVIYYHTHHFLEDHQYMVPELTDDFTRWVKNSLDNQVLGERLSIINTRDFNSLAAFRDKLVNVIEAHLAQNPVQRDALPGEEFYFIRSVDVILPTTYAAEDLREFAEALRRITPSSLYFHVYASRLRLQDNTNDFIVWLADEMDEQTLSQEIARIDPYSYTLEGLRSLLVQTVEKHIR